MAELCDEATSLSFKVSMMRHTFIAICFIALGAVSSAQTNPQVLAVTPSKVLAEPAKTVAAPPVVGAIHWSTHAKNVAQVFFWITVGTVTALAYLRAKKDVS